MNSTKPPLSWFVIQVTAMASLGGCLFGYDMGAISGALPLLAAEFDLSESQQEWVVSILYLGGGLGALLGGTICDAIGRQRCILGTDGIFVLGALLLFHAETLNTVLVGRFTVGFAVAVSGIADVSYLHEIAPPAWRGAIVSVNEACISLGFLLAYVAGFLYSNHADGWRWMFAWAGILAVVQLMGMWNLPESPTWLDQQGRAEDAALAWERIHGRARRESDEYDDNHEDDTGFDGATEMTSTCPREKTRNMTASNMKFPQDYASINAGSPQHEESTTRSVHSHPAADATTIGGILESFQTFYQCILRYRQQVYVALFLSVTQQLCGQTNVLNYAPIIFAQAVDGDNQAPWWSTLAIGVVKFAVTVLVIWKIETLGRRVLLLTGMTVIGLGLLCLMVAFGGYRDPDNWNQNHQSSLALPGVLMVVCGYSMSFGPLTWLLTSELFPTDIRGRALGASTIVTYLCASFVTRTFLSAQSWWGPSKVFGVYFIVTAMGIVFSFLAIPDTGEKNVAEVEMALQDMWWWRFDRVALQQEEEDPIRTLQYSLHNSPMPTTSRQIPDMT